MPKGDFDFEDPFELNGMAFLTHEDTTKPMAECFIEEFMRMGYGHKQLLALFANPHYVGPNLVYQKRGAEFIRKLIEEVFARWGKPITWAASPAGQSQVATTPMQEDLSSTRPQEPEQTLTDPMGTPIPKLSL